MENFSRGFLRAEQSETGVRCFEWKSFERWAAMLTVRETGLRAGGNGWLEIFQDPRRELQRKAEPSAGSDCTGKKLLSHFCLAFRGSISILAQPASSR